MLDRYERFVAPAVPLADPAALERIGERWELEATEGPACPAPRGSGQAGRTASSGTRRQRACRVTYPRSTPVALDGAGQARPHGKSDILGGDLGDGPARSPLSAVARPWA